MAGQQSSGVNQGLKNGDANGKINKIDTFAQQLWKSTRHDNYFLVRNLLVAIYKNETLILWGGYFLGVLL